MSAFMLALVLFGCTTKPPATTTKTTKPAAPVNLASMETSILQEVNAHRKGRGLPPLQDNSILATEAAMHSQQMASKQVPFGHDGYSQRMSRIGQRLGGIKSSAENVAYGKMNAREVVAAWLKSSSHKKNIEGNFNLSGIGISRDAQGIIYYTQIFSLQ